MTRSEARLGYVVASLLCFVAGVIVSGEITHFLLGTRVVYAGGASIVGWALLYAPFVALALLGAAVEKKSSRAWGAVFFGVFVCVLEALYFRGYWYAEVALLHKKWTASALAIGLLPFKSIPVVAIAALIALLIPNRSFGIEK